MKQFILSLFAILVCASMAAQVRFSNGWIIDNDGQKMECLIKNVGNFCSETEIVFRKSETDKDEVAYLKDVASLFVNGTLYERHDFSYDNSQSDISAGYSLSPQPEFVKTTAFLRVVCDGPARLYRYEMANIKDNFFISTEVNPEPTYLINKMYLTDGRSGYLRENTTFRQQLFVALAPAGITEDDVNGLRYDEASLIDVFDKSNGTKTTVHREGRSNIDLYATYRPAKEGQGLGFGLSYEFQFSRRNYKWACFFNLEYKNLSEMQEVRKYNDHGEVYYAPERFKENVFQVAAGARYYMYLSPEFNIYLDGGLGMGIGSFDNVFFGTGFKVGNFAALGVRTNLGYQQVFSFGKAGNSMEFFNHAWPVTFYAKFSIPTTRKE